jgi:hypothetical protein
LFVFNVLGDDTTHNLKDDVPSEHSKAKYLHAYAYIKRTVESEIMDRSAFESQDTSLYLPYRTLNFFYGEYDWYCKHNGIAVRGHETTFRNAYKDLKQNKLIEGSN